MGLIGQVSQQKYTGLQMQGSRELGAHHFGVGEFARDPQRRRQSFPAGKIKGDFLEEVVYRQGLEGWTLTSPLAYGLYEFCAC